MRVQITYCGAWNFLPQASSLAARIQEELGVEAELIRGGNGIFDVVVDGKRIFSKDAVGRFPEDEEILAKLRSW